MAITKNTPDNQRSEQDVLNRSKDDQFEVLATMGLVYNPATDTADRLVSVDAAYVKYDADDSAPTYIGINSNADALDGDTDWMVYKFTYSGSNVTAIRRKSGSWTGRAGLFS
jgi:hypothetical protein